MPVSDWRLNGQEEYLSNAILYKVTFPDFWKNAYAQQNAFYLKIRDYAVRYVETTHHWEELFEGESVGRFWHEHCEFCWEKAYTNKPCVFYCTEDLYHWIKLALEYIFKNYHYQEISAGCYCDNVYSLKMLNKVGFVRFPDGDIKESNCFTGEETTQLSFKISKGIFEN